MSTDVIPVTTSQPRHHCASENVDVPLVNHGEVAVLQSSGGGGGVEERAVTSDIVNGWFNEHINVSCSGHAMCIKVKQVVYHEKSEFQDILIFDSDAYGRVLVLDGIINCTERDECSYQEMLTNLALCSHPDPQAVLIIGGGDGGVAREVAKHSCVRRIVQCEIDGKVISACKKYLPSMSCGFDDPRVDLRVGDGFAFIDEHHNEFDVIITDSSDPIGPAEVLFQKAYFQRLCRTLKSDGIIITQGQSMWIPSEVELVRPLLQDLRTIYPVVSYAYTLIPTYTMGQIGFILASKNTETKFEEPVRILSDSELEKMKYYNVDVHRSSFVMPQFIRKMLIPW